MFLACPLLFGILVKRTRTVRPTLLGSDELLDSNDVDGSFEVLDYFDKLKPCIAADHRIHEIGSLDYLVKLISPDLVSKALETAFLILNLRPK